MSCIITDIEFMDFRVLLGGLQPVWIYVGLLNTIFGVS